jgi:F0F1-type ATP synthase assembly protein I
MTAHPRLDAVVDRPLIISPDHGEVVAVSDNSSDRSAFAMFGALTGIATLSAALVVGGAAIGLLVDDATGAPHVFVFLGLVLGTLAAFLATRSIIRRFFR